MAKPEAPFELDGASIYPEERDVFRSLITIIYTVDPNRPESAILKHVEDTFRQIMRVRDGKWVRRKVFEIGSRGMGLSVVASDNPEYPSQV